MEMQKPYHKHQQRQQQLHLSIQPYEQVHVIETATFFANFTI